MITATGGKQYQRDYAVSIAEFVCQNAHPAKNLVGLTVKIVETTL